MKTRDFWLGNLEGSLRVLQKCSDGAYHIAVRLRWEKVSTLPNKCETESDSIKLEQITNFSWIFLYPHLPFA